MRYSAEPRFRKYVKEYGFLPYARKFGDKSGKKLMDKATKTLLDTAKTASKRVVQTTAEATGDLLQYVKQKEKQKKYKKRIFHQQKVNKLLMILNCLNNCNRNCISALCNLVENDYKYALNVLFGFIPNKKFGNLLNISPHFLTIINIINTEFSVEVWFADQSR